MSHARRLVTAAEDIDVVINELPEIIRRARSV